MAACPAQPQLNPGVAHRRHSSQPSLVGVSVRTRSSWVQRVGMTVLICVRPLEIIAVPLLRLGGADPGVAESAAMFHGSATRLALLGGEELVKKLNGDRAFTDC